MKKKNKFLKIIYCTLVLSLMLSMVTSCKAKEEKPKPPEDKKDEIPKGLTSIEEKSEEIVKDIEKIQEEMKKPPEPKKEEKKKEEGKEEGGKEEKEEGGEKGEEGKESDEGKEGKESEEEKKKEDMTKEEKIKKMWEDVDKKVEEVHTSWNNYETKAIEDGAASEVIKEFENSLNQLTMEAENKNDMKALYSLNNMTLYMAKFFDLYKGNPDGEILRLKYYARQIHLDAESKSWDSVSKLVPKMKETNERLRQKVKLPKEKEKLMNKLNLSVEDLQNAIKEENPKLLKIKRDIVLKNLEEIRGETK